MAPPNVAADGILPKTDTGQLPAHLWVGLRRLQKLASLQRACAYCSAERTAKNMLAQSILVLHP